MAYKTKVLLIAIARILSKSETLEEAYNDIQAIANVEGVILESLEELRKEKKNLG